MSLARYALVVLGVMGSSLALLWPALAASTDPMTRWAAFFGGALAAANALLAYCLVLWSAPRSTNVFLGTVLGGMLGRMGLMLAAVIAAILVLGLPRLPLVISLLSYFVLFLVFELAVLQKTTTARPEAR